VSGEFWTIPKGMVAPGKTNPGANVPIIGSTSAARSARDVGASASRPATAATVAARRVEERRTTI
jgi:hypothetical protein